MKPIRFEVDPRALERRAVMLALQEYILLGREDQVSLASWQIAEFLDEELGLVVPVRRVETHLAWWAREAPGVVESDPGGAWLVRLWESALDLPVVQGESVS
jgi:hypothetical protein